MIPISKYAKEFDVLKYFDDDGKFKPTSFSIPQVKKFHTSIRFYYGYFKFMFERRNEIASYDSFLKINPKMTLKDYNMIISFYCDPRIQKLTHELEFGPVYTVTECCTCSLF